MQTIQDLTKLLLVTIKEVSDGTISIEKGMAIAYIANTILKSLAIDIKCAKNSPILRLPENTNK
jgi:hypothetical protein